MDKVKKVATAMRFDRQLISDVDRYIKKVHPKFRDRTHFFEVAVISLLFSKSIPTGTRSK